MISLRILIPLVREPRHWLTVVFVLSLFSPNTFLLTLLGLSLWVPVIFNVFTKRIFPVDYLSQSEVKLLLALMFYAFVSLLWSPYDAVLTSKEISRIFVSAAMVCVFLYSDDAKKLVYFGIENVMVLAGALAVISLLFVPLYYVLSEGLPDEPNVYRALIVREGILYHYETVAWFSGLVFLLMSSKFINLAILKRGKRFDNFLVLAFPFLLIALLFVLTLCQSGATFLGVGVGLFYLFLMGNSKKKILTTIIFITTVLVVVLYGWALKIPIERTMLNAVDIDRTLVWRQGLSMISEAQLFGHGFGASSVLSSLSSSTNVPMHFHNVYLAILYYGGISGLIIFLLLILSVIGSNFGVRRRAGWFAVFLMALSIFFFDGNHVITYLSSELYIFLLPILMLVNQKLVESNANA